MFGLVAWLIGTAWSVDFLDQTDDVHAEVCVEIERDLRAASDMRDQGRGFAVPESWARARAVLGRGRLPSEELDSDEFVEWLRYPDPAPQGEDPVALVVETAPHPTKADRILMRVGVRSPEPTVQEREAVHLVALVNVAHTMRSVPTRTYPLLQDVLPDPEAESWFFPKVDRLTLARQALKELVGELPRDSVVAMAAFDRGAHIALEPTPVREEDRVAAAIEELQPGFEGDRRGLDVVEGLVRRMRSFCGDTRVLVFSDGPTGLGGDPDQALDAVAELASKGVTVSTMASAIGLRRVPQLEQLAWVGYGKHHYVDTLGDAVSAFRRELAEPGWIARDLKVQVEFAPGATSEVKPLGDAALEWYSEGVPRGLQRSMVYEVVLADGADAEHLVDVTWEAGSPVPGEWTRTGGVSVARREVPASFDGAPSGVRLAWIAGAFADHLSGRAAPSIHVLYEQAVAARREGVREDVELIALLDRTARLQATVH